MLEDDATQNENNISHEDQPEPKKRKYIKATDFKNVSWKDKVLMLIEHL